MRAPLAAFGTLIALVATTAHATLVTYSVSNVAGASWTYDYTIENDTLGIPIEEFTIYFDRALYANLAVVASPDDWDSIALQPDSGLPDNGFFDALALSAGVGVGASLSGFSVSFEWLGIGIPGFQPFDVIDALTFATLDSGMTLLSAEPPPTSVPEPSTLSLLGMATVGIFFGSKRRKQQRADQSLRPTEQP